MTKYEGNEIDFTLNFTDFDFAGISGCKFHNADCLAKITPESQIGIN